MEKKEFVLLFVDLIDNLADNGILIVKEENNLKEELRNLYDLCEKKTKEKVKEK